ncbi:MAG: hypothetical protein LLG01_10585 [Planctomycetaceae bacterium]|nr:hypothetical protein [Planctomycetaceae bacterium]
MKTVSIAALILVLLGLAATIGLFAFEEGLKHAGCNLDVAALGVLVVCLVACIMGFVSLREPAGKVAAILGALLVGFFAYQFLRTDVSPQVSKAPPLRAPARVQPVALEEMTPVSRDESPRNQAPPRRQVVVVMPKSPPGEARFEGFNDLRVISTGPVGGPVDNQNYQLYVGGYVGPFIGPGGCQWSGRHAWPGSRVGGAFYLRYGTPPQDDSGENVTVYGAGGE